MKSVVLQQSFKDQRKHSTTSSSCAPDNAVSKSFSADEPLVDVECTGAVGETAAYPEEDSLGGNQLGHCCAEGTGCHGEGCYEKADDGEPAGLTGIEAAYDYHEGSS